MLFIERIVVMLQDILGWFFRMIFLMDNVVVNVLFERNDIVNIKQVSFFFLSFKLLFCVFLNFYSRINEQIKVFFVLKYRVRVDELLNEFDDLKEVIVILSEIIM